MRRQFVLDNKTSRLLNTLAADRGRNFSAVVRDAIRVYAEQEAQLDAIESDPAFIAMMRRSENDIREGRVYTQEQIEKEVRARKRRKR